MCESTKDLIWGERSLYSFSKLVNILVSFFWILKGVYRKIYNYIIGNIISGEYLIEKEKGVFIENTLMWYAPELNFVRLTLRGYTFNTDQFLLAHLKIQESQNVR